MERVSNTILVLADTCFQRCVNPISKTKNTHVEDICIRGCVQQYFAVFKELAEEAGSG